MIDKTQNLNFTNTKTAIPGKKKPQNPDESAL
jgi:hypothetical protein